MINAEDVAVCTIQDIGLELSGDDAQRLSEAINEYLSGFASPLRLDKQSALLGAVRCLKCGAILNGIFGTFVWGVEHGEGMCGKCGWPCRALHRPKDKDGNEIFENSLEVLLQYYPSQVDQPGKKEA